MVTGNLFQKLRRWNQSAEMVSSSSSSSSGGNCGHWFVRHRVCLVCKTKVSRLEDRSFNYLFSDLHLSHEAVSFTKRLTSLISIYRHKKLHLVLDLDHTLIHSVKVSDLSEREMRVIEGEEVGKYKGRLIKFRPFVKQFLEEANKLFNMSVYTKARSDYAHAVVRMLDPNKTYFGDRVITRRESPNAKTLDLVLADERRIVIVDNTLNVWPHHQRNLVQIRSYLFFKLYRFNKDSKSSFAEKRREEGRKSRGGLNNVLEFLKEVHNGFFSCGLDQELDSKDVRSLINGPFKPY